MQFLKLWQNSTTFKWMPSLLSLRAKKKVVQALRSWIFNPQRALHQKRVEFASISILLSKTVLQHHMTSFDVIQRHWRSPTLTNTIIHPRKLCVRTFKDLKGLGRAWKDLEGLRHAKSWGPGNLVPGHFGTTSKHFLEF